MADSSKILSPGTAVADLEVAWMDRLEDAKALRRSRRYSMPMVFGYYALEILLKVRICKHLRLAKLPKALEFHDLDALLIMSGLQGELNGASSVKSNWDDLKRLVGKVDELRYGPATVKAKKDADAFHYKLWESDDGVIPWLKERF
jgi:hypothetical protein